MWKDGRINGNLSNSGPRICRDVFNSTRQEVAKTIVFRTSPLSECIRSYPQLAAYETIRRSLLPDDTINFDETLIWDVCKEASNLFMDGQLSGGALVPLALAWKGNANFLGWGAASPLLPKSLRIKMAYLLGMRYEKLNRVSDSINFYRQAATEGVDMPTLKEQAEAKVNRLENQ